MIVGIDEAGVGCLAGPLVIAAVGLDEDISLPPVRDSKKMSEAQREDVIDAIYVRSDFVVVGEASVSVINRHQNIWCAWDEVMRRVLEEVETMRDGRVIVDGVRMVSGFKDIEYEAKADDRYREVSAASVVAKYVQTSAMEDIHDRWPYYEFVKHHGYGTAVHSQKLKELGPCAAHRISYAPVQIAMEAIQKDEPDRVIRLKQLDLDSVVDIKIIGL